MDGKTITLILTAPDRPQTRITCDSVRFSVPDGVKRKNAGGGVGIRRGHADALMAVSPGKVLALLDGKTVFSCTVGGGLAAVTGESVSILTDRYEAQSGQA